MFTRGIIIGRFSVHAARLNENETKKTMRIINLSTRSIIPKDLGYLALSPYIVFYHNLKIVSLKNPPCLFRNNCYSTENYTLHANKRTIILSYNTRHRWNFNLHTHTRAHKQVYTQESKEKEKQTKKQPKQQAPSTFEHYSNKRSNDRTRTWPIIDWRQQLHRSLCNSPPDKRGRNGQDKDDRSLFLKWDDTRRQGSSFTTGLPPPPCYGNALHSQKDHDLRRPSPT